MFEICLVMPAKSPGEGIAEKPFRTLGSESLANRTCFECGKEVDSADGRVRYCDEHRRRPRVVRQYGRDDPFRGCLEPYCSETVTDDDGRVKRCPKHRRVKALLRGSEDPRPGGPGTHPLTHSGPERVTCSNWARFRSQRNTSVCPYCLEVYVSHGGSTKSEIAERQRHARNNCVKESA